MKKRLAFITILLFCLSTAKADFPRKQVFSGGADFKFDGSMSQPAAPSAAAGPTSGGSCTSARIYSFYTSYKNSTGETILSPAGTFQPSSGSVNKITVTRATIPSNANTWRLWFSRDDAPATIRGCSTLGNAIELSAATSSFDCLCATSADPQEPTSNTTHLAYSMRSVTNAAGVYLNRSELAVEEVCTTGCEFTTVPLALTSITDASASKRYVIYVRAPYIETSGITMKSYVSIVGENRNAIKFTGNITLPNASGIECGFDNINFTGGNGIISAGSTAGNVYVTNSICGDPSNPTNVDCFVNLSGGAGGITWYTGNNVLRSRFDFYNMAENDVVYDSGSIYIGSNNADVIRLWADGGGAPVQYYIANPTVIINPAAVDFEISGVWFSSPVTGATQGSRAVISGGSIRINSTYSSRTATMRCALLGNGIGTNSNASEVSFYGTECVISSTSASGKVLGMEVQADADHSNWTARWIGGRIAVSGGATASDFENQETVGGFSLFSAAVQNGGAFTGSGVMTSADTRWGAFTTKLTGPTRDLAVGACTLGETAIDNGGATREYCVCGTANTWGCWNLGTGAFNNNGPAD